MADVDAQQLFDKLGEYHNEIVALTEKTTENVQTLKTAVEIVETKKNTLWGMFKPILPILILVLGLILAIVLMKPLGVCEYSVTLEQGFHVRACAP